MTYLNVETGRAVAAMIQGDARQDYTKIKSPALSFVVVGIHSNMASQLKALPEERRKVVDDFLSVFKRSKEKEIERFHKGLPTGRVVVFTNADHHCFIEESEVVREMRGVFGQVARCLTIRGSYLDDGVPGVNSCERFELRV